MYRDQGRRREESNPPWRRFSLGPLRTSALIVEGDGESSVSAQAVHIEILDQEIDLLADMDDWRAEIEEESMRLRAEGRAPLWNGPRYAVGTIDISRTGFDEEPEIHLRLRPTGPFLDRAISIPMTRCRHLLFCNAISP